MKRTNGFRRARQIALLLSMLLLTGVPSAALAEKTSETDAGDKPLTDLLVVCAHPGDEFLFLGGVLSYYAGEQGRSTTVLYLASNDDMRAELACSALATLETPVEVVFGGYPDFYTDTLENAKKLIEERDVVSYLTREIRRLRPAVIVTHETDGEYGHGMHQLTSVCVGKAAAEAGNPSRYLASAYTYGAYTPLRVFNHLSDGLSANIDRTTPLSRYDGRTVLEMDRLAYGIYAETDGYPLRPDEDRIYTCADYGLVFSRDPAPEDLCGDLFFGIDASLLSPTASPVPTSAETPTPAKTPAPTNTPTPTPTSAPTPTLAPAGIFTAAATSSVTGANNGIAPGAVPLLAAYAVAALSLLGLVALIPFPALRRKAVVIVLCAVFALSAGYICCVATVVRSSPVIAGEEPAPTPTASTAPAATPRVTPTPSPTATPDPWAEYFRAESDPPEVIVEDVDNEHWEYRTDTLSVIVDRIHARNAEDGPVCYQIAHIRMRGEDAFRAGLRGEGATAGMHTDMPWEMARNYKAVLAITGDNLNRAEVHLKGILIRNGYVYSDNQAQDTLAFYPDMTVRIFKPHETTPDELLSEGVENTFSFGPTLVHGGVIDRTARRGALGVMNPRCGIGYVEPGHFVAIVVDGRQSGYSRGVSMKQLGQLFYISGCTEAYNLDGGSSAAMVFMGEYLSQHRGTGSDIQRPWADAILFGESDAVPDVGDPLLNDGDASK